MINQIQKSACALVVLASTSLPALAESIDVRIIGSIKPPACTPSLSGGGTVDYGNIDPATLSETDYTVLADKVMDFSVSCTSSTKVALKPINGRPGTVAGAGATGSSGFSRSPVVLGGWSLSNAAGLGSTSSGKLIGGFALSLLDTMADGVAVNNISSFNNGTTWAGTGGPLFLGSASITSAALPSELTPVEFKNWSGKLVASTYINKLSELDMDEEINLDGLATLELVYL